MNVNKINRMLKSQARRKPKETIAPEDKDGWYYLINGIVWVVFGIPFALLCLAGLAIWAFILILNIGDVKHSGGDD